MRLLGIVDDLVDLVLFTCVPMTMLIWSLEFLIFVRFVP